VFHKTCPIPIKKTTWTGGLPWDQNIGIAVPKLGTGSGKGPSQEMVFWEIQVKMGFITYKMIGRPPPPVGKEKVCGSEKKERCPDGRGENRLGEARG